MKVLLLSKQKSIGEGTNLELCDNQSKATTNGFCLFTLYYKRKKKTILPFFGLKSRGRREIEFN